MKTLYLAFVLASVLVIGLEDYGKELDVACIEGLMSDPTADVDNVIEACQRQEDQGQVNDVSEGHLPPVPIVEKPGGNDITTYDEIETDNDNDLDDDSDGETQRSDISRPQNAPFGRRRRNTRRRQTVRRRRSVRIWLSVSRRRTARRRGRPFKTNGCSKPRGLSSQLRKAFAPACNSHQYCYYYKYHSRKACDQLFVEDMFRICMFIARFCYRCQLDALRYYAGVRAHA